MATVPSPKRRILLVEDNTDTRVFMRMMLELDGHVVDEAKDGMDGLRAVLKSKGYDIAFIDLNLPGMDGYELVHTLRESAVGRDMSLVALTGGRGRGHEREDALEAGFDAFLLKPVSAAIVNAILTELPRH